MANTLLRVGTITINRRKLISRAPTPHIAGTAGSSWVCCLPVNTFWSPNRSLLVLPMHFWMNAHNTVKFLGPDHLLDSVNTYFRSNSWLGIFKHYILRIFFVIRTYRQTLFHQRLDMRFGCSWLTDMFFSLICSQKHGWYVGKMIFWIWPNFVVVFGGKFKFA